MTVTYSLAPEPIWVIINNQGTVAGGAKMYTRSSLDKTVDKPVFQDAGGTIPWTNPIIFDLNGTQGPFYWKFDTAAPDDLYYIFVNDADGNLIWDQDDFTGGSGGGGGGTVTTYIPLTNYIANNQFIDHCDDTTTTSLTDLVIAPSNHKGFTPSLVNPVVGDNGVVGSDIRFLKNSTANTDSVSFVTFSMATAPFTGDVTPIEYVRYQCTTSNPGETYKCFQFPITQKVKNLSNQAMTFKIWAAVTASTVNIQPYFRQYFGSSPTASTEVRNPIGGALALTTTWTQYNVNFTIDSVAAKTLGTPGAQTDDDALYIQLEMPLNTACDVLFTKPKLYLGTIDPSLEFEDYDQINSINSTPRTGDIKTSLLSSVPRGWVAMNDGTIGNAGSGADRENKDTFQLYKTIWDGILDAWAPVSTGRGATAVADFLAGKTLTLPRSLGRALAGAGTGSGLTARVLGEYLGAETISIAAMPAHTHPGSTVAIESSLGASGSSVSRMIPGSTTAVSVASQGGSAANGNMSPTSFFNVFIKL